MSKRVVVYVDGLNFYSGLKAANWKRYYWLDLVSFFSKFLMPHQILQGVDYFSCQPSDIERRMRQQQFFLANKLDPRFTLHLGALDKKRVVCNNCSSFNIVNVEKESDVRMASTMIKDIAMNRCDISILVSGDRDFLPTVQTINELKPHHKIFIFFPPGRTSFFLKGVGDLHVHLDRHEQKFTTSLLPPEIILPLSKTSLFRPQKWS